MTDAFRTIEEQDIKAQAIHEELAVEIARMMKSTMVDVHNALYRASISSERPIEVAHIVYEFLAHHKEKADGRVDAEEQARVSGVDS